MQMGTRPKNLTAYLIWIDARHTPIREQLPWKTSASMTPEVLKLTHTSLQTTSTS